MAKFTLFSFSLPELDDYGQVTEPAELSCQHFSLFAANFLLFVVIKRISQFLTRVIFQYIGDRTGSEYRDDGKQFFCPTRHTNGINIISGLSAYRSILTLGFYVDFVL